MADTAIEWTDAVWNPTTGCDKVSPGCGRPRWPGDEPHGQCYALTMAKRLKGMGQAKYQNDGDPRTSGPGFGITTHDDALTLPLRWRKPRRVFVNSMSDLFHARVPREFVARVFAVMASTPEHTYQVLTKRPLRMARMLGDGTWGTAGFADDVENALAEFRHGNLDTWPLPNVWLGTSVEDKKRADERIPALLETPAAVRWLSCEPLLGHVDLAPFPFPTPCPAGCGCRFPDHPDQNECGCDGACTMDAAWPTDSGIHWVVVGGESGPGARPMHPWWVDDLLHQCLAWNVPFFFKQWGQWRPARGDDDRQRTRLVDHTGRIDGPDHPLRMVKVSKAAAGRELDGRTWDEFPAVRADGR